jgi:hypothetical protein
MTTGNKEKDYDELWGIVRCLTDNKKADLLEMLFGWMESAKDEKFKIAIDTLLENHFKVKI